MDNGQRNLLAIFGVAWTAAGAFLTAKGIFDLIPGISPGWIWMFLAGTAAASIYQLVVSGIARIAESKQARAKAELERKRREDDAAPRFNMPYTDAVTHIHIQTAHGQSLKQLDSRVRRLFASNALWTAICAKKLPVEGVSINGTREKLDLNFDEYELDVGSDSDGFIFRAMKPKDPENKSLYVGLIVDSRDIYRLFPG